MFGHLPDPYDGTLYHPIHGLIVTAHDHLTDLEPEVARIVDRLLGRAAPLDAAHLNETIEMAELELRESGYGM
jgi:hypothetical protein